MMRSGFCGKLGFINWECVWIVDICNYNFILLFTTIANKKKPMNAEKFDNGSDTKYG